MTLGKLLHPLALIFLICEVGVIMHTSRCPEERAVRSHLEGLHTGLEVLSKWEGC